MPADAIFVATQVCASSVSPAIISPLPRPIGFNTVSLVGSELGVVPIPGACITSAPGGAGVDAAPAPIRLRP